MLDREHRSGSLLRRGERLLRLDDLADGNGEFERLIPEIQGNLTDPLWIQGRIAFLSDHEGYGNLYSVLPDGSGLRRHTDHEDFYVRHASTDGQRIIFESAGELWILPSLDADADAEAVKLEITLGSASPARRPAPLKASEHLGDVFPNVAGTASAVEAHGTIHWLRHKDGPSRVAEATPGVRARLPRPLTDGRIAYVADHGGVEAMSLTYKASMQLVAHAYAEFGRQDWQRALAILEAAAPLADGLMMGRWRVEEIGRASCRERVL